MWVVSGAVPRWRTVRFVVGSRGAHTAALVGVERCSSTFTDVGEVVGWWLVAVWCRWWWVLWGCGLG